MGLLEYVQSKQERLLFLTIQHAQVVVLAMTLAVILGVAVGMATYRTDRPRQLVLAVAGVFLTIPSFALFGILIAPLGIGLKPTVVALVMYALLPIVRNTITGLREVDPAVVESAMGMGMSRRQRLLRIELPIAWPVIVTGVRVSTVMIVGIAAIAAYVNGPGLGGDIFSGLERQGSATALNLVLSATIGVALLGLLFDAAFLLLRQVTTSKGIR